MFNGNKFAVQHGLMTPVRLVHELDKFVVGQHKAKKILAVTLYNHFKRLVHNNLVSNDYEQIIEKSNVLLIGKSGTGKTHLIKSLAKVLDLKITHYDLTQLTETGWQGDCVTDVLKKVHSNNGFNLEETQRSVVFLDEFDKICKFTDDGSIKNGIDTATQQDLLKFLEGGVYQVEITKGNFVSVDTTNILFVCAGVFPGLKHNKQSKTVGFFSHDVQNLDTQKRDLEKELLKYGVISELLGRLPVVVELETLTFEQLLSILKDVKNSFLNQYKTLFKMDNVVLEFTDEALLKIVKDVEHSELGVRGLRNKLESVLLETMYNLPSHSNVEKITITESQTNSGELPIFQLKQR